jgi:hypothetical protein
VTEPRPDPDASPYGPARTVPTTAPTDPQTEPAPAPDSTSDETARAVRSHIVTWNTLAFVALLGGAVGMFAAVLAANDFDIGRSELLWISVTLFIIVTAPPIRLLVLGSRHRRLESTRSIATSATVWGIICLFFGLLAVGPTLVTTATAEIRDAIARTRPLTAAETAYSPADLADEYRTLVDDAAAAGGGVPMGSDPIADDNLCELGNLDLGRSLKGIEFYLTDVPVDTALDAIEKLWQENGYTTQRFAENEYMESSFVDGEFAADSVDPYPIGRDYPLVVADGGPFTWASAYVYDGYDAEGFLRLYVDYETICVAR